MFKKVDKIQMVIAIVASLLIIVGFFYDHLSEIGFILMAINLFISERKLREDKKSIFSYVIIAMAVLILFLSIRQLVY